MSQQQEKAGQAAPARRGEDKPLERWHVVLLDDDQHTYDYVINLAQRVFGCGLERAFEMARTVDTEGRVICGTYHKELAELKRDQIHGFGPDALIASCKGAMSARLERAD